MLKKIARLRLNQVSAIFLPTISTTYDKGKSSDVSSFASQKENSVQLRQAVITIHYAHSPPDIFL
jgi:predicted glycosyltransferase